MSIENKSSTSSVSSQSFKNALRIFKYIGPYKYYFILGIVFLVLGSLIFMAIPAIATEMANEASGTGNYGFTVNQYALALLVLILAQGLFSYFRTVVFAIVSENGIADIRKDLYKKLITQPISFYEETRVGELTSRLTTDVEQLQSAFSITLAEFLRQIIMLITGLVILAWLTPKLSMIMLLTFPVIVISAMFFGRFIRKLARERQKVLADTNVIVEESLHSFSVVKAFTNELFEVFRYSGSVDNVVKVSLRFARIRGIFYFFIISILFGGIMFILWRGALLIQSGEMTAGDLFGFILYTGIIGGAIAGLGNLYTTLASAIGATERVQEILQRDQEVNLNPPSTLERVQGNVRFENVHFVYPTRPDIPVLRGIDFDIKAGDTIALVGQSGSGKSTIAQLLMRFYTIQQGSITIDNRSIYDMDITTLRKNVGIVPQEVILFGGSIRENISYGDTESTEEQIIDAAKKSNCWEFISSFPEGLETIVGERGMKLSGGQRQRIAIARAILKDPSILILDEATSSLDAESEKVVQDALNILMKGRTSIVIAHRLATIREADMIYVLDDGKIIERGNHEMLMKKDDGIYKNLASLQFEI